jgi:L-amino acid N-acyltransferase YncA
MIRYATNDDAVQICEIYNYYVLKTSITFDEQPILHADMEKRMQETMGRFPWLVWDEEGHLLGYCYASEWKGRCSYRYSVESTVYVEPKSVRKGIGSQLYGALLAELRKRQFHTVIGGIALPNISSVALHEKCGFQKVAQFKEVGNKFGIWIDVGYWQLLL